MKEFFDIFVAKKNQYVLLALLIILSLGWLVTFFVVDEGDGSSTELGRQAESQEAWDYSNGATKGFGEFLVIRTRIKLITENAGISSMCRGVLESDGQYATFNVTRFTFFGLKLRSEGVRACK